MSRPLLAIPHRIEAFTGGCLPACLQMALVIVGIENDIIIIHDPAFEHAPIPVPIEDFLLAWYEFGNQWAMVTLKA